MSIVYYKNFKIDNLTLDNIYISYDSKKLYIQTPLLTIQDIIDINNKTYLQLKINNNSKNGIYFINTLLSIENKIKKNIKDDNIFFNSQIIKDINENIYIKVKVMNVSVFDKKKNIVSFNSLRNNMNIICIINYSDIYFDTKNIKYGYSIELDQIMII
jgi:hypothetical protein